MPADENRPATPPTPGPRRGLPGGRSLNLFWVLILVVIVFNVMALALPSNTGTTTPTATVPYSVFVQHLHNKTVLAITMQSDVITGTFTTPQAVRTTAGKTETVIQFTTRQPTVLDPALATLLQTSGVQVTAQPADSGSSLLSVLLTGLFMFGPVLLLIGVFIWLGRRNLSTQQGIFSFGRSKARLYEQAQPTRVTFADVAGVDECKDELVEIVGFLKDPAKYQALGGTLPRGVLLVGPPGTGKTLLAKAVAGEANVPFFSMSASEFVEMLVGVGASRVRDLFAQAKAKAPAIIFVDELDAVGRQRGAGLGGGNDEREQTINQLLAEMDGFESNQAVIVLAATNRPDVLDPALLRPGRFDRRVVVPRPDRVGRLAILRVHTRRVPLAPDVDLPAIAASTPGLVGAELRNLVNEAALLAAHRERLAVTARDFTEALEKITLGVQRRILLNPEEHRRVAFHEAGHALLGVLLPEADPVQRVTIVPRGLALGVTYQIPLDDRYNYSEGYLRARIVGALGGRAAEEEVLGEVTSGAENDLQQGTEIARQMVTKWGMSRTLGLVALGGEEEVFLGRELVTQRAFSDATAARIDEEVKRIMDECYAQARDLLHAHRAQLEALADALLEHESLDEQAVLRVVSEAAQQGDRKAPVAASTPSASQLYAPRGLLPDTTSPETVDAPVLVD